MVPLPSHSHKQWGQLGEILGGVRRPERGASRGSVLPPMPGEVVSNTGKHKTAFSLDVRSNGGRPAVMTIAMSLQPIGRPLLL